MPQPQPVTTAQLNAYLNRINNGGVDEVVKVRKDNNLNTQVDSGEMLTLAQANVASIDLGYYNNYGYGIEANGNYHKQISYYQDTSGNYKSISDVWFKANRADSVDTVQVPINATIQGVFELRGTGTLVSLHKAMALTRPEVFKRS